MDTSITVQLLYNKPRKGKDIDICKNIHLPIAIAATIPKLELLIRAEVGRREHRRSSPAMTTCCASAATRASRS